MGRSELRLLEPRLRGVTWLGALSGETGVDLLLELEAVAVVFTKEDSELASSLSERVSETSMRPRRDCKDCSRIGGRSKGSASIDDQEEASPSRVMKGMENQPPGPLKCGSVAILTFKVDVGLHKPSAPSADSDSIGQSRCKPCNGLEREVFSRRLLIMAAIATSMNGPLGFRISPIDHSRTAYHRQNSWQTAAHPLKLLGVEVATMRTFSNTIKEIGAQKTIRTNLPLRER